MEQTQFYGSNPPDWMVRHEAAILDSENSTRLALGWYRVRHGLFWWLDP